MHKSSLKDSLIHTYQHAEEKVEEVLYDAWHIRLHKKAKHHLHKLRKRPDHHKDIISFIVATIVTICVCVGWYFISLPHIIKTYEISKKENAALNSSTNPFTEIRNRLQGDSHTIPSMADTNPTLDMGSENIQTQ